MITIGITGGVGAGKSAILEYIKQNYNARIILADDVANEIKLPGECCYEPLIELLGEDVLDELGYIDRGKMAAVIFSDAKLLTEVNNLMHPMVKKYIVDEIQKEKQAGKYDFFYVEAALLIEEHYDEIVDELWYIYTEEKIRRERLKANRHYSDAKIDAIMAKQLPEAVFREKCQFVIDNSKELAYAYNQIKSKMEELSWS